MLLLVVISRQKMRKAISISMASKRAAGYKKQLKPKGQPTIFHHMKYKCPQTESENVRNVKGEEYQMLSCQTENHPSLKVNHLLDWCRKQQCAQRSLSVQCSLSKMMKLLRPIRCSRRCVASRSAQRVIMHHVYACEQEMYLDKKWSSTTWL